MRQRAARLLIRGGTSSVGMAAIAIAAAEGIETAATTRQPAKVDALIAAVVAAHRRMQNDEATGKLVIVS
ncbi:hypothetical protein [Nocardia nova]|uniref:hypothetical protein n=1 Tax=Nocardia nova TaxID=37330 RepID=UPI0007A4A263|nr:hypothetical protein [Nocardia nova]